MKELRSAAGKSRQDRRMGWFFLMCISGFPLPWAEGIRDKGKPFENTERIFFSGSKPPDGRPWGDLDAVYPFFLCLELVAG